MYVYLQNIHIKDHITNYFISIQKKYLFLQSQSKEKLYICEVIK